MAELQGGVRAVVGKSHAASSLDVKVTTVLIGVIVVMAALVVSWAAEGATPRKLYWQRAVTEEESPAQDFHDHLAHAAELLTGPVFVPVVYPERTAPGVTVTMHGGFSSSSYRVSDPAIRAGGPRVVPW